MKMKTTLIAGALLLSSVSGFAQFAATKKTPVCPSQDFKVFLDAFTASKEVQKAFTQLSNVPADKVTYPIIPSAKTRKSEGMTLKVEQLKKNSAKVVLDKDQTDYRIEFYFQKQDCWTLVRAEDVSG